MAAADGLLLHVPESPAAAPRTLPGPRRAQGTRQAEATKRKHQASSEAPPAKQRNEASFLLAKKAAAKETQRTFKGKAQKTFSPKKSLVGVSDGTQEQKPCIRTSSLFKNNPEIPELHRPVVKQVQEKVFTSDAFHELDLHPHLISTINTVLNMTSMTSVQKQSIPALLEGRDALVRSQTGSGKTLAYCIPVVQSLQAMKSKIQRSDGPYALVLVPTREKSRAAGPQEIRERATVLQTVFEDYVHSSSRRVSWAKKALQAFIRAYATYPRELKHIFHVRSLHLGHVAKSFGLRDAPQNLSVAAVKRRKANLNRNQNTSDPMGCF
ncbi:probable ATP-dependent RNA helicase DDX31 [Leptonychotes weddellii]|uniref:ATP-dependent RNA helicase n=1 Tax=Leptonychotes weddellii TaxID=9713 RepID=A0A7F8RQI5_LEPWE|nr:probable ATP-dependent RNA helicase DDX31 [Leptonychotes weddellii]